MPTVGEIKNGRGEFFDQEPFNGRTILIRVVWSNITRIRINLNILLRRRRQDLGAKLCCNPDTKRVVNYRAK